MTAVTTRHSSKPFAASYSRLKNYESCPRRHQQVDILKNFKDESDQLDYGERVHKAAAARLGSKKEPLPKELEDVLGKWVKKIEKAGGQLLVEQKLAITRDFKPCGYFDRGVWFRSVADVIQIKDDVAGNYDWKTGKILEDSVQLALSTACVFAHYPKLKAIKSVFIWLKEDATTTDTFQRDDIPEIWRGVEPRIKVMQHAYETDDFPPHQNKLCWKYCPVKTCEFHGVNTWS